MKYVKKFQNNTILETYKKSNFVTPHVYLDANLNTIKCMQEYQQLEYISSTQTGGQYIDLGCKLFENNDQLEIEIKFNFKGNGKDNHNQAVIMGGNDESNTTYYPGMVLRRYNESTEFKIKYIQFNYILNNTLYYCQHNNGAYATAIDVMPIQNIYTLNIITTNWPSKDYTTTTYNHNKTTTLFCGLNSSGNPFRYSETDLYYLKIKKGGQVIRNLIPVKKLPTNEIGLYDMENDHLYVSQGDNPFVAGPII